MSTDILKGSPVNNPADSSEFLAADIGATFCLNDAVFLKLNRFHCREYAQNGDSVPDGAVFGSSELTRVISVREALCSFIAHCIRELVERATKE